MSDIARYKDTNNNFGAEQNDTSSGVEFLLLMARGYDV